MSRNEVSLMAMVPLNEWRTPTFITSWAIADPVRDKTSAHAINFEVYFFMVKANQLLVYLLG